MTLHESLLLSACLGGRSSPGRLWVQGDHLWVSRRSCPLGLLLLLMAVKDVAAEDLLGIPGYLLLWGPKPGVREEVLWGGGFPLLGDTPVPPLALG